MRINILFILLTISCSAFSQINKYGTPLIQNYSNEDYDASEQNWSAVQDNRGIMYYGNNDDGVLEYDGVSWRKIAVSNKSIVRSLAVDKNGRVYVGAIGEFGLLAPDITGNLKYISLSQKLDTADSHFADVHKIYCESNKVFFCSPGYVFVYDGTPKLKVIRSSQYNFLSFVLDGKIYSGDYFQGLLEYTGDSMKVAKGGDFFGYMNIVSITKFGQKYRISTASNSVYNYDFKTGLIDSSTYDNQIKNHFINSTLYNTQNILNNQQSHSTLYGSGLIITDEKGKFLHQLQKKNGLQDDQIAYSYQNLEAKNQPLWVTLGNGISKISNNLPFTVFDDKSGIEGMVLDVIKHNGTLYVATTSGVFYQTIDENNLPFFKAIDGIGFTWKLFIFTINEKQNKLLAGSGDGLFEIVNKNQAIELEKSISNIEPDNRYKIDNIYQSKSDKNLLILGANKSIVGLRFNGNSWKIEFELPVNDGIKSIVEDNNRNIWFGTSLSGVMKFSLREKFKKLKTFDQKNGLRDINTYVFELNGSLMFSDDKGVYNFDGVRFIPEKFLSKDFSDGSYGVFPLITDSKGFTWFELSKSNPKINKLVAIKLVNGKAEIDSIAYKILPNVVVDVVYEDDENNIWIGNSKGLFCYNRNYKRKYYEKYQTLIRKVIVGADSVAFNGTFFIQNSEKDTIFTINNIQPEALKTVLKYSDNNITFQFSAPFFDAEELTLYSSQLEGYRDNEWSKWDAKTERVFTNLKEGDYIFRVKAKNVYGVESEIAVYEFSVLPPWYRTYFAYFGYIILLVVVVYFIIKFYTRKLELDKIRLEGIVVERTAEVVKQKDEVERQKDVVMQQKEHIEHIHHELKDSIFYAERIQKAILPHKDYAEENMDDHFILFKPKDIVSGDFYFANKYENTLIFAAADCTGHGVPGAFMSMLGVAFLNEIVNERIAKNSGQILDALRQNIIKSLQQTGKEGENKDGMDLSLCSIDLKSNKLQWTGANNPLYLVRKSDSETETLTYFCNQEEITIEPSLFEGGYNLYEFKPDKMPVAIYIKMDNFSTNTIDLKHEDAIYVFTDGFADQFGGPKGKKYMYKPFKNLILSMQEKALEEHKHALDESIELWKAHIDPITNDFFEQVDDICVIGYKFRLK